MWLGAIAYFAAHRAHVALAVGVAAIAAAAVLVGRSTAGHATAAYTFVTGAALIPLPVAAFAGTGAAADWSAGAAGNSAGAVRVLVAIAHAAATTARGCRTGGPACAAASGCCTRTG